MLLLSMLGVALATAPVIELAASYECYQPLETDWEPINQYSNGYTIWRTEKTSKVKGVEAESFALVNRQGQVEQFTFVYDAGPKKIDKLISKIFKTTDNTLGGAAEVTASYITWLVPTGDLVLLKGTGEYEVAMIYICTSQSSSFF